jgi:hypothetical protein
MSTANKSISPRSLHQPLNSCNSAQCWKLGRLAKRTTYAAVHRTYTYVICRWCTYCLRLSSAQVTAWGVGDQMWTYFPWLFHVSQVPRRIELATFHVTERRVFCVVVLYMLYSFTQLRRQQFSSHLAVDGANTCFWGCGHQSSFCTRQHSAIYLMILISTQKK